MALRGRPHPGRRIRRRLPPAQGSVYGPGHAPDHVITYDTAGLQTARYRFVTDQVGSILGLVDDAGAWVLAYDYTLPAAALAQRRPRHRREPHPFGFAAGLHDPTTRPSASALRATTTPTPPAGWPKTPSTSPVAAESLRLRGRGSGRLR
ncbi:MAG: hypothetical protein R3F43_14565 [bacterium]